MSPLPRLVALAATAAVLAGGAAGLAASLAYPRLRRRLATRSPAARTRLALFWAAVPWLASAALLALCFLPSVWSLLGLAVDHCPLHDDGHLHLCLAHAPHHPVTFAEWALLSAGAAAIGTVALRVLRTQVATWRAVRALVRAAGSEAGRGGLVSSAAPLSVTAGLLRPLVLVSTGLRSRLARGHLEAVLAHERAHARRRDPLRLLAVALLGAALLPRARRLLLADAALACEQAADEEAARAVGDRTIVAEAIVAVERLLGAHAPHLGQALGMVGCATEMRVDALLREPVLAREPSRARLLLWAGLAVLAVAGAFEIHHLTETVLDLIAR